MIRALAPNHTLPDLLIALVFAILVLVNIFSLRTSETVGSPQATPIHTVKQGEQK